MVRLIRRPASEKRIARAPADEPRARDRKATERALLEAAVEVFARRGYDAATTKEVGATAGVNEVLIQRYFGGKAGLLLAILVDWRTEERRCEDDLPPARETVREEIESYLEFSLRHVRENRDMIRVIMYRATVDAKVAAELAKGVAEGGGKCLLERLRALRKKGEIGRGADIEAAAHAISTLGFALAFTDQIVLGVDRKRLRAVIAGVAKALALGLA